MDPLDRAAEATMTMTDAARVQAMRHTRRLTQAELARLASHLVGTEMPVPVALRALDLGVELLLVDDLEALAGRVARCPGCRNWTWLAELVSGWCTDCLAEQDDWDE
jgi:glutamine synthetase adenylyltransferase